MRTVVHHDDLCRAICLGEYAVDGFGKETGLIMNGNSNSYSALERLGFALFPACIDIVLQLSLVDLTYSQPLR